jgi:hypothetical protein
LPEPPLREISVICHETFSHVRIQDSMTVTQKMPAQPPTSFMLAFWAAVFGLLSRVSLFTVVRKTIPWLRHPSRSYAVVEAWVIAHTVLAGLAAISAHNWGGTLLVRVLVAYGGFRVFEITIYQVNVLLFDEWRATRDGGQYALRGYRRLVLLLLHNYAEILLWFMAVLLVLYHAAAVQLDAVSLFGMFSAALALMTSFGAGNVAPESLFAATILGAQAIVGLFMTLLTLARFVSLLPSPETLDDKG